MANATFNGVQLGDFGWVETSTENEVEVHKIPRADGSIIRRRGGGLKTIIYHGWIIKTVRKDVEQYFAELASNLTSAVATLTVDGISYNNCILKSISQGGIHNRWARFTITFLQSG